MAPVPKLLVVRPPRVLKAPALAVARRFPPRLVRQLPAGRGSERALVWLSEVLMAYPVEFERAETRYGFAIGGSTADLLQRNVYVFGVWEPDISRWVRGFLQPGDAVVDVGANVGYFSLLSATAVGGNGRVIAFEPVPSIVERLRANLALNGVTCVTVEPVIASDEPGSAEIFRSPDGNLGLSATKPDEGFVSEGSVRMVCAADAIDRDLWPRIRLVKVDVEGDDLRALRGLEPLLATMAPGGAALVEISPEDLASRGSSATEIMELMRTAGFSKLYSIANSYENLAYARDEPHELVPLTAAPDSKADVLFLKPRSSPG